MMLKSINKDIEPDQRLDLDELSKWSDWLMTHHTTQTRVWLRIKKKNAQKPGISLSEAVIEALRFGWIDGRLQTIDQDYFYLRFTPRKSDSVWSLINKTRAETLIKEDKMMPMGLKAVESGKQAGTWQAAYTSYNQTELPMDLKTALECEPKAQAHYQQWSNSDKLQVIFWINSSKTSETRMKRIQRVIIVAKHHQKVSNLSKKSDFDI